MIQAKPYIDTMPSVYDKFALMAAEHKAVNTTQSNSTKTKQCDDIDITIDNVAITAGKQEGLFSVISAYVGQGDEVIMFDPIFDTYA